MKEQLRDALLELKSARLIIALLQDIGKVNALGASNTKPSQNSEARVCDQVNSDTIPVIHISSRKSKKHLILYTANRFEVLANLKEESVISSSSYQGKVTSHVRCHPIGTRKTQSVKCPKKVIRNVQIIGDSHARKCASLLQDNLGMDFAVSSFVKPGAPLSEITKTASEAVKTLKHDDDVVVWGEANDIGRNNTKEALKHITNFVTDKKEVNIVLINSPQRHDLIPSSCVN